MKGDLKKWKNNPLDTKFVYSNSSDPARIWTWNLQIRSQMPYPLGQGAFLRRGQSVEKAWITLKNEKMKSIPNNSFIKLLFLMLPLLKLFVYRAWEIKYLYLSSWLFLFLVLPDFLFGLILRNSKINPGCLSRWNMWEYMSPSFSFHHPPWSQW